MFNHIKDLAPDVIGFVAHGRVTISDRYRVLGPSIDIALQTGRVRLLYTLSSDFAGYDHGGLYDEVIFGRRHFADFDRIAFVAVDGPYRRAAEAMSGLMLAELRVFSPSEIGAARAWLEETDEEPMTVPPLPPNFGSAAGHAR